MKRTALRWFFIFALLAAGSVARGDDLARGAPRAFWSAWEFEPGIVAGLFLLVALYASGLRWLRAATHTSGKLRRETFCFAAGWGFLAAALVSPLHPWGQWLFSAHMLQHELLMVAAAPLLVLGRPMLVCLWAFPRPVVRGLAAVARRTGLVRAWHGLSQPFVATIIHAAALWLWHVPAWFAAAARSGTVHALQHASFLFSALLFWQGIFFGPQRRAGYGLATVWLFFTALQTGALGALITFAGTVWYPGDVTAASSWGLTRLEDQQLGGLIMWVPGGISYVIAALALFAQWLRESDHTVLRPNRPLALHAP